MSRVQEIREALADRDYEPNRQTVTDLLTALEHAERALKEERDDAESALTERDAFQSENHRLLVEVMGLRTRLAEAQKYIEHLEGHVGPVS